MKVMFFFAPNDDENAEWIGTREITPWGHFGLVNVQEEHIDSLLPRGFSGRALFREISYAHSLHREERLRLKKLEEQQGPVVQFLEALQEDRFDYNECALPCGESYSSSGGRVEWFMC